MVRLQRMLMAYNAVLERSTGYVQGMNDLLAPLLETFGDEVRAGGALVDD